MANSTPSRPGQANLAGSPTALFLDLFGAEILTTFEAKTQMRGLHRITPIVNGKTKSFPVVGQATGGYHVPGTEITGSQIGHDQIKIDSDDKLVSSVFIADIDEIMNHFEVRSLYGDEIAGYLARNFDANVMRAILIAARSNAKLGQGNSTPVTDAALNTDAAKLFEAFSQAKVNMDLKNVDVATKPIYGMVKTANWYALQASEKMRNRDYNPVANVAASKDSLWIDGVSVLKSNISPLGEDNRTVPADLPARYKANFATSVGFVWTPDAVVTGEVQGVSIQHEEQISKQGHLIVGRYMSGTNTLRATDSVELRTAIPAV